MTNITKAAQALDTQTLRELVTRLALEIDPEAKLEAFPEALAFQIDMARAVIRAALQDKAGEVRGPSESRVCRSGFVESDQQTVLSISDAVRVCPYKDADCGDRPANWCDTCPKRHAQQPAPVVPDDHPLMVFAKECELGAYMEHEVTLAARKAIAAAQQNG